MHRTILALAKDTLASMRKNAGTSLASEAAYSFAFSLFPFLWLVVTLVGLIGNSPGMIERLTAFLERLFPTDTLGLVRDHIHTLQPDNAGQFISLSLVLILWPASSVFHVFMKASTKAYGVEETRPIWQTRSTAILLVIITGVLFAVAFLSGVMGPLLARLFDFIGLRDAWVTAFRLIRHPLSILMIAPAFGMLYRFGPNLPRHIKRVIWPGTFLAGAGWVATSVLFGLYVTYVADYNKIYGTLGGFIILLLWMYLTSLSVIAGAEFNAAWYRMKNRHLQAAEPKASHASASTSGSGSQADPV